MGVDTGDWGPNVSILSLSFEHFQMACLNRIFSYFFTQSDTCRLTVFYFDEGCLRDTIHLHVPVLEGKPCNHPETVVIIFYKEILSRSKEKSRLQGK